GIGDGDVWTYGGGVSFLDFGKKGNLLGLFAGVPPYLGGLRNDGQTPIHVEGFYRVRLTDNISVTPGVIWVINPTQGVSDTDTLIGTVRTTFTF
ncbi:MAG: carbohydrate porin, partial [Leptolyngbyaceae cyanobacterium CAN_BIN12]|nr:carbohydrate porin [Leptolyngbyaceae cyanobacterium CAN_BIN12]